MKVNVDPSTLAAAIIEAIAPYLAFKPADSQQDLAIWQRVQPLLEERGSAREALEDLKKNPDDDDARAAVRLQLRKILADDAEVAAELAKLVGARASELNKTVTVSGSRSVAIGGDVVTGTILVTGDRLAPL
jgi:hypothetical protein